MLWIALDRGLESTHRYFDGTFCTVEVGQGLAYDFAWTRIGFGPGLTVARSYQHVTFGYHTSDSSGYPTNQGHGDHVLS